MSFRTGHGKAGRLPVLQGILPFRASQLPAEIIAGATLAALAIPEVMGYTKISGTPVITGLYTILIPTVLFALFGSSRHLVVGADSATAAILAASLGGVAAMGSDQYVAAAGALALMAAGLLLTARVIGLGFMADFLSRSVLIGFLTGVGIQVALREVSGLLGVPAGPHAALPRLWHVLQNLAQTNFWTLGLSLTTIAIVVAARKLSKRLPGPLLAIAAAIALSAAADLGRHTPLVGEVPGGLPQLGVPQVAWSWTLLQDLFPTAFAMFVVILAQSAATSRAYAARYNERFSEDSDLVGLALANIGAGLSGAFVVNGSPTKTQMVDSAGGRTQISLLVTAAIVAVVLLFMTKPLSYLPEAVLSAIVFMIGIELTDFAGMRRIFVQRRSEFWIALITAAMVVVVGVEDGIVLAIVLSLIEHTRHGYRPKNALLLRTAAGLWRPRPIDSGVQAAPGLIVYRFTHSLYFANSELFSEEVASITGPSAQLRWLCLDAAAIDDIDFTAAETLRKLVASLRERGIRVVVSQLSDSLKDSRYDLRSLLGEGAFFDSLEAVFQAYEAQPH